MLLSDNQLHELYEINDDPKRKEFLDDLFSFMQKRGTPINRLPIMAKSVLDLYELYNLVIARGGLVDVINKKLWQEIIKGLHLPSSITSAAFTLRTQYMKYLYPYECEKKNLSTPAELQAAIDGNRREGRRSSYGQFEAMHSQLQLPQMQRPPNVGGGIQQMSPLALVTHANQQSAAAAAAAAAHHRLMAPPLGQMPNIVTHELEQRMMEYLKLFQQKEQRRSQSPEITPREALSALEMSRVALWSMYHNNTSPPSSVNASPVEPQREALNLSDSPPSIPLKRERENSEPPHSDREEYNLQPPMKKSISSSFHELTIQQHQQQQEQEQQQQQQQHQQLPFHHHHQHKQNDSLIHQQIKNRSAHFDDDDDEHDLDHHDMDDDDEEHDMRMHHSNLHDTTLGNDRQNLNGHHVNIERKTPPSSPIKSIHNGHHNGDEFSIVSGMQFKITKKGNGPNGEQQLLVNLDLNGIHFEGILFANPSPSTSHSNLTNTPSSSSTTTTVPVGSVSPIKLSSSVAKATTPVKTTNTLSSSNNNLNLSPTTNPINRSSIQSNEENLKGENCNSNNSTTNGVTVLNGDSDEHVIDDNGDDSKDSVIGAQTTSSTLDDRIHSVVSS